MPIIDVTDVLLDPVVAAEQFLVIRRTELVNNYGESKLTVEEIMAAGAIQPSGDNALQREDDSQTQTKSMTVITTFRLRGVSKDADGNQFQPDIIRWAGNDYIVASMKDYVSFGGGMVEAEVTGIDYVDYAPDAAPESAAPPQGQPR